jgi:hypothetical protein
MKNNPMTNIPNLDLHGIRHEYVPLIVEEWALLWSYRTPAFTGKIITGNSTKMRVLVEGALTKHNFKYTTMADNSILVTGNL